MEWLPFGYETETHRINRLINADAASRMTDLQFFAEEIREWRDSPRRMDQIKGEMYYEGRHDILTRRRTAIGRDGRTSDVDNIPNNRLIDNLYALMVDQKTNYLVGRPFAVSCGDEAYLDALNGIFGRDFYRLLKYVCEDALKGGIAWVCPYYDREGRLAFKNFPAYEILPFWADDGHTVLDSAARLYRQEVWEGRQKRIVERAELFLPDGLHRYVFDNGVLIPDVALGEHEPYFAAPGPDGTPTGLNWERIPLVAFKYNKREIPLLNRVKTLQDGINTMLSDYMNGMQEDPRNTILVLKNYDGQDLGEFRYNLAAYGAVKVREEGGVETLSVQVNADNYKSILDLMKKSLIANARGYDAKDDRLGNNPNQMNIQSMYSDIDLDANGMETEFQAAFDNLLWFIDAHLANTGRGDFSGVDADIIFNRDVLINESEVIANIRNSVGILSDETLVANHPWVKDPDEEMAKLEKQKQKEQEEMMQQQAYFGQQGQPRGGEAE